MADNGEILKAITELQGSLSKQQADQHGETIEQIHQIDIKIEKHVSDPTIHFKHEMCPDLQGHLKKHKNQEESAKDTHLMHMQARGTYVAALVGACSAFFLAHINTIFKQIGKLIYGS